MAELPSLELPAYAGPVLAAAWGRQRLCAGDSENGPVLTEKGCDGGAVGRGPANGESHVLNIPVEETSRVRLSAETLHLYSGVYFSTEGGRWRVEGEAHAAAR